MEKIKLFDGELKLMELLWACEGTAEDAAKGAAEDAAKGVTEGAAEDAAEGAAKGITKGITEGMTESVANCTTAKELARLASDKIGWNKNTTYTVIKKLIAKGAIERTEPDFICRSLVTQEDVGRYEAKKVLKSFFGGSAKALFSSFMADSTLSAEEADELKKLIDEHTQKE